MSRRSKVQREWTWAELCCLGCAGLQPWRRIFTKKWFNISSPESDFSADEVDAIESESESEEECDSASRFLNEDRGCELPQEIDANCIEGIPCELYRQKSETLHAKHKTKKELRICVGTWNVGGRLPSDDLSIDAWLEMEEAADIYVLGFQEIVPLNAENVLGAEDSWPVERWEYIIRETLNKTQPVKAKHKCSCSLPSPSSSKPSDGNLVVEDHVLSNPDCESYKDIQPDGQSLHFPFNENQNNANGDDPTSNLAFQTIVIADQYMQQEQHADQQSFINMFDSSGNFSLKNNEISLEACTSQQKILSDTISSPKRISLLWTEQSSEMLDQRSMVTEDTKPLNQVKSIEVSTSYTSANGDNNDSSDPYITCEVDLETINRKKKSSFARIISKQMVGILLSIWVRTSLRKHVQNVKISTVGVGLLGYMGNKGSISVSMSIYQTFFCFVCCHLTSGEKDGDELRRNTDVQEIHRRTLFGSDASLGMPRTIFDHETIIWLGDLNYRINLSYDRIHDLISRKEWRKLFEKDQLKLQLKEGGTFHGWSEGEVNFPPTYKYEFNSEKYTADDPKGRRTPAWCDRILSFGKGLRLLEYKRAELLHSDHRPVTAIFAAEVEIRRALTSADTEVEEYVVSEA